MSYQYPMERVLYNLHHQVCTVALRRTSSRARSLAEHSLLLLALSGFGALLLAHLSFVYRGGGGGGMRLEVNATDGRPLRNIPMTCLSSIPGFVQNVDITLISLVEPDDSMPESRAFQLWSTDESSDGYFGEMDGLSCNGSGDSSGSCLAMDSIDVIYSYSKVRGYLLLPAEVCAQHNISVQHVMVSKADVRCFGEPFLQCLIFRLLAPDTAILNWLLATHNATGFVYDPRAETMLDLSQHYSLQNKGDISSSNNSSKNSKNSSSATPWYRQLSSKLAVVLKTSFLFFITTTLVSFTLRETQERMLDFTHQLQAHVRSRRSVVHIVTTHIAENLVFVPIMVGMMFFLIEFYRGDRFLAFMVLTIVWLCEVFSVISLRSSHGIHFFPRIFFLLFALFHFYLFSFPFGFSYTALASTVCFMMHSMLFFWHRYELPAVALGLVTVEQPRMGLAPSPFTNNIPSLHEEHAGRYNPPGPSVALPQRHQLVRQLSHGTAASSLLGRASRQASSTGLFNAGEDGDESYMYFMDGEVVMHREQDRRTPSPFQHPTNASVTGSIGDPVEDGPSRVGGIPDRILAEVGVLDSVDSLDDELFQSFDDEELPGGAYSNGGMEDPPETSALQAILHVHGTPRTNNLSRDYIGVASSSPKDPRMGAVPVFSPAPVFPHLRMNARQKSDTSSLGSPE